MAAKQIPKYLYHYTKLSTLYHLLDTSVLRGGEDIARSMLCFHATDINAFDDNLEHSLYLSFLKEVENSKSDDLFNKAINGNLYVISFSTLEDNLPMWKLYSENGKGICLKFRSDKIEKTMIPSAQKPYEYIRLSACKYERDNNLSKQYTRLKKIYLNGAFEKDYWRNLEEFNNFKLHCALLKDASYKFEQEYRLVKADQEYSFRPSVDGFIPYTEIKLPLSCLVEIQTGPFFPMRHIYSLNKWLEPLVTWSEGLDIKINNERS